MKILDKIFTKNLSQEELKNKAIKRLARKQFIRMSRLGIAMPVSLL